MKDFVFRVAFLACLFIVIPFLVIFFFSSEKDSEPKSIKEITLYNHKNDCVTEIDLEKYITGVVAAEMPASFSENALKAQAVAARTYALRKVNADIDNHKGADLCTDYAHCQAYYNDGELKKNWRDDYESNIKKIKKAVYETRGEYLEYGGDYAITVFHSCSNGKTENAADVWGGDIAYLKSVDSPGDKTAPKYKTKVRLTVDDFKNKLKQHSEYNIDEASEPIGEIRHTEGGNVSDAVIYNCDISGTDIRKIFGLRSTAFEIKSDEKNITFSVTGNGHGVGMSQYGANEMGKTCDYKKILSHYYPGTDLKNMYKQ